MRHIAARCVWAEVGPEGIVGTFRIDEEGQLVDAEDESYAPPTHSIALLHPVEDPEAAGAWGEVFGDYEIVAAFDQLARPAHRTHVASFPVPEHADGPEMSPGHVQGVLSRHRWEKDYDYVVTSFHKRFGDRNVTATIHFHPGMQPRGCDTPQQVCGVSWRGTPDPVVLSEVLATVHALQA
jgi:hypothetical protein